MKITETNTEEEARAEGYDHVNVSVDGWPCGFRGLGESKIALQRCPICKIGNYALCILSGICHACGFDINKAVE